MLHSLFTLVPVCSEIARADTWPNFRGIGGLGVAGKVNPPLSWDAPSGQNILWRVAVPRSGMSSPIVLDDKVFLTGADDSARDVYCFSASSGELNWTHELKNISGSPSKEELPFVMEDTGFAAPTMATDGQRVAALFATGDLVCLDTQGRKVWAKNLGVPVNHYGHASSLLSQGNLLYVQYDQREDARLMALDFRSGGLVWESKRNEISWSSPVLIENQGRLELIVTNSKSADSYQPSTGELLWHIDCLDGELAPSPAFSNGMLFVANEYASASGIDISPHRSSPKIVWSYDQTLPEASSPLAFEDLLIIASAYGAVSCLSQKTGQVVWEHDFDVGFYSSPVLVNRSIYLADLDGNVHVFKADRHFEPLSESSMGEDVYATPAFVLDRIYIRTVNHLFCISRGAENPNRSGE